MTSGKENIQKRPNCQHILKFKSPVSTDPRNNLIEEESEVSITSLATASPEANKLVIKFDFSTVTQSWINKNKYTLICFTCAEGDESWFTPNEYTYFGQAFSHCIAQHACDKSLITILNLTCDRMSEKDSPEIRLCKMNRDLYPNPGLPKN